MIDTHAHIDSDDFAEDLSEVISRSFDSAIESIIIPAIEPKRFEKLFEVVNSDPRIFCGMGVHPHNANEVVPDILKLIYDTAKREKKVVAIGEIGLDYFYDFAPKNVQIRALREQLEIAKDLDLPVIIHNRESDDDLMKTINEAQDGSLRGVFHCFYGDTDMLKKVNDMNFIVSFTGNVTFKKFDAIDTVKNVAMDKFMIETDSPYMTPAPFRGKRNEPSYVKYVAQKIADIKNIEIEEVINMTTNNAKKFFGLLSLMIMFVASSFFAYSQADDEYYDENEHTPYDKFIGFGPLIGANTIVESFNPRPNNVSYEGLLAVGGIVHYGLTDFIILSGSYTYSKNTKLQQNFEDLEPNIHQSIEISANFIANPYSKINLYGFVGPSYLLNNYGVPGGGTENKNHLGINTGLGFFFNIPINGAGLLSVSAEWKLNFMIGVQNFDYDSREKVNSPRRNDPVEITTFFSIPRLNLIFYPTF